MALVAHDNVQLGGQVDLRRVLTEHLHRSESGVRVRVRIGVRVRVRVRVRARVE